MSCIYPLVVPVFVAIIACSIFHGIANIVLGKELQCNGHGKSSTTKPIHSTNLKIEGRVMNIERYEYDTTICDLEELKMVHCRNHSFSCSDCWLEISPISWNET